MLSTHGKPCSCVLGCGHLRRMEGPNISKGRQHNAGVRRVARPMSPYTTEWVLNSPLRRSAILPKGVEPVHNRGDATAKMLTFNADGAFAHEDGAALAQAIDDAISPEFNAYIVCLEAVETLITTHSLRSHSGSADVRMKASIYGFAPSNPTCITSFRRLAKQVTR